MGLRRESGDHAEYFGLGGGLGRERTCGGCGGVGTTPSILAINVTNALFDSHKHLGKGIYLQHIQSLNHVKSIIHGKVLYCLFQSGGSGLMEEKAKNEGTALVSSLTNR